MKKKIKLKLKNFSVKCDQIMPFILKKYGYIKDDAKKLEYEFKVVGTLDNCKVSESNWLMKYAYNVTSERGIDQDVIQVLPRALRQHQGYTVIAGMPHGKFFYKKHDKSIEI